MFPSGNWLRWRVLAGLGPWVFHATAPVAKVEMRRMVSACVAIASVNVRTRVLVMLLQDKILIQSPEPKISIP